MSGLEEKKSEVTVSARPRTSSQDSYAPSLKASSLRSPRTARFAEATAVNSPIEPSKTSRAPFADPAPTPTNHYMAQPQPSDVGFGYVNKHESVEMPESNEYQAPYTPRTPLKSPLKSAMKTPGAAPKDFGGLKSPAFTHEEMLEKREAATTKVQAKDLKIKTRVRLAKILLRGVNFSCALIVVSMLATTFTIFRATMSLPPRNGLPPWAPNQKIWPQVTLMVIAAITLAASIYVIYQNFKRGNGRAEKAAVYYTVFAAAFFIISLVMWGIGAGLLQGSKSNSDNKDMWGWACVNNERSRLFENEVSYALICRLQNWSLVCCIIEIVVETLTIAIYGIIFYRFYSKRQLRKSMAHRDRARSDMYLAQLRGQSAPNTPGIPGGHYGANGPLSARDGGWKPPVDYYEQGPSIEEGNVQYIDPNAPKAPAPKPFQLQPPPIKVTNATPKMSQAGFQPVQTSTRECSERSITPPSEETNQQNTVQAEQSQAPSEQHQGHFDARAPGEQVYESVPIPGAYASPVVSSFPR